MTDVLLILFLILLSYLIYNISNSTIIQNVNDIRYNYICIL